MFKSLSSSLLWRGLLALVAGIIAIAWTLSSKPLEHFRVTEPAG
jgi:hypothetical protein